MIIDPTSYESLIQIAVLCGFIGIGFGALIGVSCRVIISTVDIVFNKIVK